jgi:hypothetical protein
VRSKGGVGTRAWCNRPNAMGLYRGPKVIRRYLLLHPVLEVDEPGEPRLRGDVLAHPPGDAANQRPSFGCTILVFVVRQLAVKEDKKALTASTKATLVASIV